MEAFSSGLGNRINKIELFVCETDKLVKQLTSSLEKYADRAKETLKKKHIINPKPQKRFMRIISENDDENNAAEEEVTSKISSNNLEPPIEVLKEKSPQRESLRPVRTAKANANKNLKEVPANAKLRNDNGNVAVKVKAERVSTASNNNKKNRDSAKENTRPRSQEQVQQRESIDEGIQMGSELDLASGNNKRSMSVEIIPSKPEEIEIVDENDADKMPPPPIPGKNKKKVQKQSNVELPIDPTKPLPVRITRSKIKKEKQSIGKTVSSKELKSSTDEEVVAIQRSASESVLQQKGAANESTMSKKGAKKKYPMPILVKIERISVDEETTAPQIDQISNNDIENVPPQQSTAEKEPSLPNINNETVTITPNLPVNQTVTLANNNLNETYNKNAHDSLMTEDNDEDCSMEVPPVQKLDNKVQPPALPLKFKKNEVFNPYLSSPVKQKVQAFEKHAVATPDKMKATTSKYSTLKSGTPSKIALYSSSKTTPMNNAKQKYIAAITGSASSASTSSQSSKKLSKKFTSITHDSNEDLRKIQAQSINQQLEEKKRQREEKQRQVQLQREAIEKQKREQVLQQQREREEKFRKIMHEKEEAKRLEALKKKMHKENQEKKYAEERAKKEEFSLPKEPQSASKDDSLYMKVQKQIMAEKTTSHKKKLDKKTYSFDMLNTDDSTDDESQPSKKRPEPPQWSKKQVRQKLICIQSFANSNLLDTLFSAHPINVNLKEIFPSIDARKLVRNSSAVWNTPPRYSQIPKY